MFILSYILYIYILFLLILYTIPPISLTFGRQCGYHTNSGRLQIPTRATRQTFRVARFFFPMAPSLDGERAGPLANMLFGPKHGGRHH
jgi:hypothetical protein